MFSALQGDGGLPGLFLVAGAAALIWLLLGWLRWRQIRTYNLTLAESSGPGVIKPDFLKVDQAKRQAALAGGGRGPGQRPPEPPPRPSLLLTLSGLIALLASVASFLGAAFGVLQRVEDYNATALKLSSGESFVLLLQRYPIGFAIAAAIIVVQLILLLRRLFRSSAP